MLGKKVSVVIQTPELCKAALGGEEVPVAKGRLPAKGGRPLYYFGNAPAGAAWGVVIAVAEKGGRECFVVAPEGKIYYEPEIRRALSTADNRRTGRLLCLFEKSCGAVVFRWEEGTARFLLVKNRNGRHWGFPKGHVELDETEQQTAMREVREETGLAVQFLDGFREMSTYRPYGKIKKQVVFFVACSTEGEVTIQASEIDRFLWADYETALRLFRYENDLRVLRAAMRWINEKEEMAL
jgi:8-oxo-dGTP pyrophosphatase MutT (NUDIX family)